MVSACRFIVELLEAWDRRKGGVWRHSAASKKASGLVENGIEFRRMSPNRIRVISVLIVLTVFFSFPGKNLAQVVDVANSESGEAVVFRNAIVVDVRTGALRPGQA